MNKIFEFLIEKRNKVLVMEENNSNNKTIHMEANIIGLGFKFSEKLKNAISNLSEDSMSILYENLKNTLKKIKGADVSYKNMVFPDFPNQTRMTSQSELSKLRFAGYVTTYLKSLTGEDYNALIGIGEGAKRTKRTNLKVDMEDLITLELGTMDDFYEIIQNLLGSRAALSESDKRYIKDFLKMEELDFKRMIPEEIPFKENMAFLYSEFLNNKKSVKNFKIRNFEDFEKIFKYVCFEDFNKHKLINLPNQKRIALLTTLEIGIHNNPDFFLESAYKNREVAIIINNRLHPISYKNRFPKTVALFKKVKEEKVEVSNAKIDRLINEGKGLEAIKVASINPGVAIRKLSRFLYCDIENRDKILKIVSKIAPKVDTNVLLSAKNYFETANNPYRIALPKGNISRAYRFKDKKSFSTETIEKTVETLNEALKTRLKNTKPSLNGKKVFINTNLSKFNVPFATRDESKSFRTVARGSRIKIKDNANVIRAFCYKKYTENKFVDLSASFVDENFNSLAFCSWQNFKNEDNSFLHSGDSNDTITGVAEFIDIDRELIEEKIKEGYRYILFSVISYGRVPFKYLTECYFGIMERDTMGKNKKDADFTGEVFDTSTVKYKFDINNKESLVMMPLIYDIVNREFIWTDMPIKTDAINIQNIDTGGTAVLYDIIHTSRPNLFDLIRLNVEGRDGELVFNPDEADIVWTDEGEYTPFARDLITKHWM